MIDHLRSLALAGAHRFHHDAHKLLGAIDGQVLQRLLQLTVDRFGQNLWLAYHQLEALAAHRLDQNCELQLSASRDTERLGTVTGLDLNRHVR